MRLWNPETKSYEEIQESKESSDNLVKKTLNKTS